MDQTQAEIFIKQLYNDIWSGHDLKKFGHYYHPDLQTDLGGKNIGFSEVQLHAEMMKQTWVNTKIVFRDIISNGGNKIAVRFNMSGIREGEVVAFEMMGIYELKENKLYKIFGLSNPPMNYPQK